MHEKIIFLDVDGVLNYHDHFDQFLKKGLVVLYDLPLSDKINKDCIAQVNRVVEATSAKVVLSTSWVDIHGYQETVDALLDAGLVAEVIDQTPRGIEYPTRFHEIQEWIVDHPTRLFVIFEDDYHMRAFEPMTVRTDWMGRGFTEQDADKAIAMLEG